MSSFKKRAKSLKRTHRERGQPSSRQHLGLLEKHKDYVLRARSVGHWGRNIPPRPFLMKELPSLTPLADYQKKKDQLKILHEKARNRNPDEFYYKMITHKLKDGKHVIPQVEEKFTQEELQIMKTQDLKYVQMKLNMETKKIERLQANLHLLNDDEGPPPNTHIIFVDSAEEVASFDPAKHFDTAPEFVTRTFSRPTLDTLKSQEIAGDRATAKELNRERAASYKELNQRVQRSRELRRIAQKMKTQKDLMSKEKHIRIPGNSTTPSTYRWKRERKR